MPRPKGSKKPSSPSPSILLSNLNYSNEFINKGGRPKKTELMINTNDDSSTSERVVVNPAVLRYLEQNRNYSLITNKIDENISMEINDENSFDERYISIDELIEDDRFWDFWAYSTEFLTTARLAEWILAH